CHCRLFLLFLEFKSVFTSSFSQGLNTSMVKVSTTIKHNFSNVLFVSAFSNYCSYTTSLFSLSLSTYFTIICGGTCERHTLYVINYLSVNVLVGAVNASAWALRSTRNRTANA